MKYTRRELGRMAAMGAASQLLQRASAQTPAPADGPKIGYAAVGLGRVSDNFMRACKSSPNSKITALVSGHREKAAKIAATFGVPVNNIYSYEEYDKIAANKEIDAVYIGLPNSMHAEYTIRAARAGKHVFCEKPMANTSADAQTMIDAVRKAGKRLMIGYRIRYEPVVNLHVVELIQSGKLGRIQAIDATSGFNIAPNEWRLNGKLAGGGPLMDMGIYALNGIRLFLGEEPAEIKADWSVDSQDPRFREVEENLTWTMKFPSGALANCVTSYGTNLGTSFRIYGSKGTLASDSA